MAVFSDTESSPNNALQAGTLDLNLDGGDVAVTFLSESNIAPDDSGSATLDVRNAGSVPGYLDMRIASVANYENGCAGNENSEDSTCGDPGQGDGELQNYLEVSAYFRNGPDLTGGYVSASNASQGDVWDGDYQLGPGASDTFVVDWRFPSTSGNQVREAQSDGFEFTLSFRLDQQSDSGY